ncbi:hypothetical protein J1N35_018139 [Gossypium stocksii]|uniref:DUF4283 domain-containing protein n=1 Tax=Gossypium stocksii TaxID=47602 RepID=A0A9D3VPC0_9ROSI|nr:hypothetical protein J1N35_018139 [Gossypium stocksii]
MRRFSQRGHGLCMINILHYNRDPWILIPQSCTPSKVMDWIRLLGLPGYMYRKSILIEIGELDYNTDYRNQQKFVRLTIYIDLEKLLVSKVMIGE